MSTLCQSPWTKAKQLRHIIDQIQVCLCGKGNVGKLQMCPFTIFFLNYVCLVPAEAQEIKRLKVYWGQKPLRLMLWTENQ